MKTRISNNFTRIIKSNLRIVARKILGLEYNRLIKQNEIMLEVISELNINNIENAVSCETIVFSKDRALQLHALISTYYEKVKNPLRLNVLYTTSSTEHYNSYLELIQLFNDKDISFVYEKNFRNDLIRLIETLNCSKIIFMTDDALIIDDFDMNEVVCFNPYSVVFQLHRGYDAKYNMHSNMIEKQPEFIKLENSGHIKWSFLENDISPTYQYPLSLDGTLFNRKEILNLFKKIEFKAPNTLESIMQIYKGVMINRNGISFEKAKYANIPCNIVNTEIENTTTGFYTVQELLKIWQNAGRIKYEMFYDKNYDEVVVSKFEFTERAKL